MKKIVLTVTQIALLLKAESVTGFEMEKMSQFLEEHKDSEKSQAIELDDKEIEAVLEVLDIFRNNFPEDSEEDNLSAELTGCLEAILVEVEKESATEEVQEQAEEITAEPVVEKAENGTAGPQQEQEGCC